MSPIYILVTRTYAKMRDSGFHDDENFTIQGEDGSIKVLRNVSIQPQHHAASQSRRPC